MVDQAAWSDYGIAQPEDLPRRYLDKPCRAHSLVDDRARCNRVDNEVDAEEFDDEEEELEGVSERRMARSQHFSLFVHNINVVQLPQCRARVALNWDRTDPSVHIHVICAWMDAVACFSLHCCCTCCSCACWAALVAAVLLVLRLAVRFKHDAVLS